jgi:hypothetical protein
MGSVVPIMAIELIVVRWVDGVGGVRIWEVRVV